MEKEKGRTMKCDSQCKMMGLGWQLATYQEMEKAKSVPGDSYCGG